MTLANFRPVGTGPSGGELCCPFFAAEHGVCRAARLTMTPEGSQRVRYCCSDDHDDCPLFLARALRSSAAGGLDRDLAAHCGK